MIAKKTLEGVETELLRWMDEDIMLAYDDGVEMFVELFNKLEKIEGNQSFRLSIKTLGSRFRTRQDLIHSTPNRKEYPPR